MSESVILGLTAALGAALCWTVSAVLYKTGSRGANAFDANTARALATLGFLLLVTIVIKGINFASNLNQPTAMFAFASGIVGLALGDSLYIYSIDHAGVAMAVPASAIYPLLTAIIGFAFFQVQFTSYALIGTITIVIGLILLTYQSDTSRTSRHLVRLGIAGALAAALLWSVSINLMNQALLQGDPVVVNLVRSSALLLLFLAQPLQAHKGQGVLRLSRRGWTAMSIGGIFGLALGWTLLGYSIASVGEGSAVPISSISPFFAVLAGALLLKERVTKQIYAGSVLIVLGAILVSLQ